MYIQGNERENVKVNYHRGNYSFSFISLTQNQQCYLCHFDKCSAHHSCLKDSVWGLSKSSECVLSTALFRLSGFTHTQFDLLSQRCGLCLLLGWPLGQQHDSCIQLHLSFVSSLFSLPFWPVPSYCCLLLSVGLEAVCQYCHLNLLLFAVVI